MGSLIHGELLRPANLAASDCFAYQWTYSHTSKLIILYVSIGTINVNRLP